MKIRNYLLLTCAGLLISLTSFSQLKIISNGNVGINNDSPAYNLDVNGTVHLSNGGYYSELSYDSNGFYPTYDYTAMLGQPYNRFSYVYAYYGNFGNDVSAYNGYFYDVIYMSDKAVKTNIADLPKITDKLYSLRPVNYNLLKQIKAPADGKQSATSGNQAAQTVQDTVKHIGFIAQEVKELFPDLVAQNKEGLLGVKYIELIPVLVQALKEQNEKIKSLEERITKLENK